MKKNQTYYWLYILKLEQNKYYVGITTKTPEIRFGEHVKGIWAADWTKTYKPLQIFDSENLGYITKEEAEIIEHQKTQKLMKKYGWKNVRGGRFRSLEYKKRFGILWRTNTEKDMPTYDSYQAIIVIIFLIIIMLYLVYELYV